MKSVRLGEELERRLEEAARVAAVPESQLIREAVRERCDEILGQRLDTRLADVTGAVSSAGGHSRRTGRQFVDALEKPRRAGRKKRSA